MTDIELNELFDYAVKLRRRLHEYPEIGFELEQTVSLVAGELDEMGIAYTDRYGTCSLVGELGQGSYMLAIRADMDALPVEEKTDLPYRSKKPGMMHACGHDSHAAILLAVARYLKQNEAKLKCKVRLIFQPSEEGAQSGAEMMVRSGVMDGVDEIICTHCENGLDSGLIGVCSGDYMAACIPINLCFLGRTSHATIPEAGIDAIAMAWKAYGKLKTMVETEAGGRRYIWSVGRFSGGQVHNVIADRCEMDISFRFYDTAFAYRVMERAEGICRKIAAEYGGRTELDWHISTGAVCNDADSVERLKRVLLEESIPVREVESRMSSEDFGWYLTKAPGLLFRFGTRNEELGCTAPAHRNDFCIDESGMKTAIRAFIAYAERFNA